MERYTASVNEWEMVVPFYISMRWENDQTKQKKLAKDPQLIGQLV